MDLSKLPPKALAAAMKGGTEGWGQVARLRVALLDCARQSERLKKPCNSSKGAKTPDEWARK